jgi:hypothetical protein
VMMNMLIRRKANNLNLPMDVPLSCCDIIKKLYQLNDEFQINNQKNAMQFHAGALVQAFNAI